MVINFSRVFAFIVLMLFIPSCTKTSLINANQKTIESFDYIRLTEVLNELIQLDIDTVFTYNQAIQAVKKKEYKNQLISFRDDHEKHIKTLSKLVLDLGGHPPSYTNDFKGVMTSGYTAIKASRGIKQALDAMETNEIISNRYYSKALTTLMPSNIKAIIEQHKEDEVRHLEAIKKMERGVK